MTDEIMDKILDRLPIFDGSGRRRFVAGGIILIGITVPNWDTLQQALGGLEVGDILTSPMIAAGAVLMVYAIGSLAEMFGELFLVRAASGIFWGLKFPFRTANFNNKVLRIIIRTILLFTIAPILAFFYALYGFIGRTVYATDIVSLLSQHAQERYNIMPDKVALGLRMPVGDDTEFALKFVIDELQSEVDRKWARRLILRAKDVAATITALQVVVLYMILVASGGVFFDNTEVLERSRYEIKLTQIDKQLDNISRKLEKEGISEEKDKISADEKKRLTESLDTLINERSITRDKYRDQIYSMRQKAAVQNLFLGIIWLPFLLLYLGFFTTLRNAVIAILEILAARDTATAKSVVPNS